MAQQVLPNRAPFDNVTKLVGNTGAYNLVNEKFDEIWQLANNTLQQASAAGWSLRDLEFPRVSFPVTIDSVRQLQDYIEPDRAQLDDYDLEYREPDEPQRIKLENVPSWAWPNGFDMWYQSALDGGCTPDTMIRSMVNVLCDMLGGRSGLSPEYFRYLRERATDNAWRENHTREDLISQEFSRRNVPRPSGVETKRIDALRNETHRNLSGVWRDIAIEDLREALNSLRQAAQLAIQYLSTWAQVYSAEISGETAAGQRVISQNAQLVAQLQADVAVFEAQVTGETARLGAETSVLGQDIARYQAEAQLSNAVAQNDATRANLEIEEARLSADSQIQQNNAELQARARDVAEASENRRFDAELWRTISAALYQAIDVGAQVSSTTGQSWTHGESESYGYDERYAETLTLDSGA